MMIHYELKTDENLLNIYSFVFWWLLRERECAAAAAGVKLMSKRLGEDLLVPPPFECRGLGE
jgi:hypothetical protein